MKRFKKTIISGLPLTLLLLEGCGLHQTYERPQLSEQEVNPVRMEYAITDSTVVMGWRSMFTDPQLQQLIEEALNNNTNLQVAKLKVEEARASLYAARKALLPTVSAGADGTISSYGGEKASKTYDLGADVSWEADIFGKLSNEKKQSAASLEEQQAYAQAVKTQLIATVAEDYYTLLTYDEQVKVSEATVESWNEYITTQRSLMNAGQASLADVSQAEASQISAQSTLQDIKQSIVEVENSLCALLGRGHTTQIARSTLEEQQIPETLTKGVSVSALVGRPDVLEAEAQLKRAFYGVGVARAAFYPSLTLSGQAGWTNSGGMGITNPGKILLQAVASLTQPIFNQGKNVANLRIAKAQQEEAALQWKQSILDAGEEVNNALSKWQTAKLQTDLQTQQVEKLKQSLKATESQMKYGSVNYLQVITVRQSLLTAELDKLSNVYAQLQSLVNLYQAVGGGTKE
jgi:NodT family efflux transporter outer membrane factor (OMF) lipoprotein